MNCPALCTKSSDLELESSSLTFYIILDFKLPPDFECFTHLCIFLGDPTVSEFYVLTFRNTLFRLHSPCQHDLWSCNRVFRNVSTWNSDTVESPKRKNTPSYILILRGRLTEIQGWLPPRTFRCSCVCCCFVLFGCFLGVSLNEENYFDVMGYVDPTYFVLEGQQRKQERKSHAVRMIF